MLLIVKYILLINKENNAGLLKSVGVEMCYWQPGILYAMLFAGG